MIGMTVFGVPLCSIMWNTKHGTRYDRNEPENVQCWRSSSLAVCAYHYGWHFFVSSRDPQHPGHRHEHGVWSSPNCCYCSLSYSVFLSLLPFFSVGRLLSKQTRACHHWRKITITRLISNKWSTCQRGSSRWRTSCTHRLPETPLLWLGLCLRLCVRSCIAVSSLSHC